MKLLMRMASMIRLSRRRVGGPACARNRRVMILASLAAIGLAMGAGLALACASCTMQVPTQKCVDPHRFSVAINLTTYLMLGALYGMLTALGLVVYRTAVRPQARRRARRAALASVDRVALASPPSEHSQPDAAPSRPATQVCVP